MVIFINPLLTKCPWKRGITKFNFTGFQMKIDISKLSVTELDELISKAAKLRSELKPEHSAKAPQEVEAIGNPAWYTALTDVGSLFQIRHPGFGWLSFIIPPIERAQLLTFLLQQALLANNNSNNGAPALPATPATSGGTLH